MKAISGAGISARKDFIIKIIIIKIEKYRSPNQINIIKRGKKLNFNFFNY